MKYKCGCSAACDNIAYYCPIHGRCADEQDDEFEKWWMNEYKQIAFKSFKTCDLKTQRVIYNAARAAWNAALESMKPKPEFGCHVGCGNPYPDCVLDTDDISECGRAETLFSEGKTKESCEYWRHVNE